MPFPHSYDSPTGPSNLHVPVLQINEGERETVRELRVALTKHVPPSQSYHSGRHIALCQVQSLDVFGYRSHDRFCFRGLLFDFIYLFDQVL